MNSVRRVRFAAFGALAALAASSSAIIATTTATTPEDFDYLYVGQVNGASGVAVGPHQFLTAGHVGAGDFTLGSTVYHEKSSVDAPNYVDPTDPTHQAHVDLTLVTVKETFSGWYDLGTTYGSGAVTMVGYGQGGGVGGPMGYGADPASAGIRRKGDNTVANDPSYAEPTQGVLYDSMPGAGDGVGPYRLAYLKQAGDAVVTVGDSGGGWFANGKLVGISSFDFNLSYYDDDNNPLTPPVPLYRDRGFASQDTAGFTYDRGDGTGPRFYAANTPYFGSAAIDLTNSQVQSWLHANVVPEPGTWAALGLGAAALLRRRRKA